MEALPYKLRRGGVDRVYFLMKNLKENNVILVCFAVCGGAVSCEVCTKITVTGNSFAFLLTKFTKNGSIIENRFSVSIYIFARKDTTTIYIFKLQFNHNM